MPFELKVREAREEDKESVLAFCSETFEWGDYIPRVWDAWLKGEDGKLLIALEDEEPVGLIHAQILGEGEGWLEGLRVKEGHRRKGIGKALVKEGEAFCLSKGATVIRALVMKWNEPSRRLLEGLGWGEVGEFIDFTPTPLLGTGEAHGAGEGHDARKLWAQLARGEALTCYGGLFCDLWRYRSVTEHLLVRLVREGRARLHRGARGEIDALALVGMEELQEGGPILQVGFVEASSLQALEGLLRGLADEGRLRIRVIAPSAGRLPEWLNCLGLREEGRHLVYAKRYLEAKG